MRSFIRILVALFFLLSSTSAKEVRFDLTISYKTLKPAGRSRQAMVVNGGIPAPTLEFSVGDDVVIDVKNELDVDTSIHWHGLLLPNRQDGVPNLTTHPIQPGAIHTFRYPALHAGTYWYHSHTRLQEQRGVYGAIIVHPKKKPPNAPRDQTIVLSDWTNERPMDVLKTLKRGSDWYSARKGTRQNVLGAIRAGKLGAFIRRAWRRMHGMDLSDVAYDAFLVNGQRSQSIEGRPGETLRLRFVNASASTYFYLQAADQPLQVVAADGTDLVPVSVQRLLIGIAETYDALVTIPEVGSVELRATAQDGSGSTSLILGQGTLTEAPDVPQPNFYALSDPATMKGMKVTGYGMVMRSGNSKKEKSKPSTASILNRLVQSAVDEISSAAPMSHTMSKIHASGTMKSMPEGHSMSGMSHRPPVPGRPGSPYEQLISLEDSSLEKDRPWREITFNLQGDMERYVWQLNGQVLSETDKVKIRKGENVRFKIVNQTGMYHPMHLHGHFFRVVNQHGKRSPWKHTVSIPPMGSRVIEFAANEEKDWFFHCHVLYHMKAGMARVISYEDAPVDPDILAIQSRLWKDHSYDWGNATILGQQIDFELNHATTRHSQRFGYRGNYKGDSELEFLLERYSNRFWTTFVGLNAERSPASQAEAVGVAGFKTVLPLNLEFMTWLDSNGNARVNTSWRIALTRRLSASWMSEYDTNDGNRWEIDFDFMLSRDLSLNWRKDSEYGTGFGISTRF